MSACTDCHKTWLIRTTDKSFTEEIKEEIPSNTEKIPRGQTHPGAIRKHCPRTRKKTRRYAQRTLQVQVIFYFHHGILITITDTCGLALLGRKKRQQPHSEQLQPLNGVAFPEVFLEPLFSGRNTVGICSELHSHLLGHGAVWDAI